MEKFALLLAMFFSVVLSAHKKQIDRFEVSIPVGSVNFGRSHLTFNNQFEILNSIQMKYFQKKIGYRVSGSYFRHVYHFPFYDCNGIVENSNSFRLSAGIQVQVVKQLKWLYAFSDLGFRRLKGTGYYGAYYPSPLPVAVELTRVSVGAELQSGVGMKLRLGKHFRIFTEAGVSVACLANTYTYPFRPQNWLLPDEKTSSAVGGFGKFGFSVAF